MLDRQPSAAPIGPQAGDLPVHRRILALDIKGSTGPLRTNPIKQELRGAVYRLLDEALRDAGIDRRCYDGTDQGDGVLLLIHPVDRVPTTRLLHPLIPSLTRGITSYNATLLEPQRTQRELRLRAVVHEGEIHRDDHGYCGVALDLAFRLLNAPRFKACLAGTSAPLALVVSDTVYWSIVWQNYEGIDRSTYRQDVRVKVAGRLHKGWVHISSI